MKKLSLFLLGSLIASQVFAGTNSCSLIDDHGYKHSLAGLSPFFAQYQVGSDLAKTELDAYLKNAKTKKLVTHSILDEGFDRKHAEGLVADTVPMRAFGYSAAHSIRVANLLNSPEPYSVGHNAEIINVVDSIASGTDVTSQGYSKYFMKSLVRLAALPPANVTSLEIHTLCELTLCENSLVNYDSGDKNNFMPVNVQSLRMLIKPLTEKSIVVASAGNFYPKGVGDNLIGDTNLIVVGSSSVTGMIGYYSEESNDVTILAPTRERALVHGIDGDKDFGMTSAAAPMVSGAVSNMLEVLDNVSHADAKELLQATAIPTLITKAKPQRNGVGVLNAYKLIRVAERLKQKGWPVNKAQLLSDPSIYDFKDESTSMWQKAATLAQSNQCADQIKLFELVRKAFLLNPTMESANMLVKLYESQGYYMDASFYRYLQPGVLAAGLDVVKNKMPLSTLSPEQARVLKNFDSKDAARNLQILTGR